MDTSPAIVLGSEAAIPADVGAANPTFTHVHTFFWENVEERGNQKNLTGGTVLSGIERADWDIPMQLQPHSYCSV